MSFCVKLCNVPDRIKHMLLLLYFVWEILPLKLFLLFVNFNLLVFCLFKCCYGTRLVLLVFWALLFIIPLNPTKSSIQRIKMNIQYAST
jgi:hypothetical protein